MIALIITVAVLAVLAALGFALRGRQGSSRERGKVWRRRLLTKNEQPMYVRLRETFPQHIVLVQVAYSALVNSRSKTTQSSFDRRVADFVLCTTAFEVIAVIELDDPNQGSEAAMNAAGDEMLSAAGYQVLRFERMPDVEELKGSVASLPKPSKAAAATD